jgi:putative transposase
LHYRSIKDDSTIIKHLEDLAEDHSLEGFWKYYHRLRNQGVVVNHKRLHRIYKDLKLPLRRKVKKRLPPREKQSLEVPEHFTQTWSIDFMTDVLNNGTKFRSFNVIDDFNREVLFIEIDYSLKSSRVIWVLRHLINRFGKPQKIRMDNGPEFISKLTQSWSKANEIEFHYIQPGKPSQNAYVERFNRSYRGHVLDAYSFDNLNQVREISDAWIVDYNNHRPHDALGGLPPRVYREKQNQSNGLLFASASPALQSAH